MPRRIFDQHAGRSPFSLGGAPSGHGGLSRNPAPLPAGTGPVAATVPGRTPARIHAGFTPRRTYPTDTRQLGTTVGTPPGLDGAGLAIPGTGRARGLAPATPMGAEGAAGHVHLLVPLGAIERAGFMMPAAIRAQWALQVPPASSAPPYHELAASVQLTRAQLAALSCPISLDDGDALLEPVALRSEFVLHVFAYDLLWQHWVLRGNNPWTRRPFGWDELLRVEVQSEPEIEEPAHRPTSAVDNADGPPPTSACSPERLAGACVPAPRGASSPTMATPWP